LGLYDEVRDRSGKRTKHRLSNLIPYSRGGRSIDQKSISGERTRYIIPPLPSFPNTEQERESISPCWNGIKAEFELARVQGLGSLYLASRVSTYWTCEDVERCMPRRRGGKKRVKKSINRV